MIAIERILCPIDFSDHSRRAFDYAVAIARWYGSAVTVIHVFSPPPVAAETIGAVTFEPIVLMPEQRERLRAAAEAFVRPEAAAGIAVDVVIREGMTVPAILDEATRIKATMIVMGTHGRSGFQRLLLGSVTERILHQANCAVLTVPSGLPDAVPAAPGLFKDILCAIDFSDSSLIALKYALSLAQEADGRLAVLHVVSHEIDDTIELSAAALGSDHMTLADFRKQRDEALVSRLADAVPESAKAYCAVSTMLRHGKPWREILRIATDLQSDLIVVGVRGRGAVDLAVFGSTAQHVVRKAPCPVLTLREDR